MADKVSKAGVSRARRLAVGANVVAMIAIAVALTVVVNVLAYRYWHKFDWTQNRFYTLSDKTKNVLAALDEDLNIYVIYSPFEGPRGASLQSVQGLLDWYEAASPRVKVEYLDPANPANRQRVMELAQKYSLEEANVLVIDYKGRSKVVRSYDLVDYGGQSPMGGEPEPSFKGEEAVTSAILEVGSAQKPVVYFASGHGERDPESFEPSLRAAQYGELANVLKRENYDVRKLTLLGDAAVPEDCSVLVIAGPRVAYAESEKAAVENYLKRGGSLMVLLDTEVETGGASSGLEDLLSRWGVVVGNNIVIASGSLINMLTGDVTTVFATDFALHDVTKPLQGFAVQLPMARTIEIGTPADSSLQPVTIVRATDQGVFAETAVQKVLEEGVAKFDEGSDKQAPLSLAVAVSPRPSPGEPAPKVGPRLVVFGDADFPAVMRQSSNVQLFTNALAWLAQRGELVSIPAKQIASTELYLTGVQLKWVTLTVLVFMPLLGVLAGVGVWLARRR